PAVQPTRPEEEGESDEWNVLRSAEICTNSHLTPQILAALLPLLTFTDAAPSSSNTCVTAIGIPSLDPLCLPLKAEGINLAPSPKFVFSKSDYCATFERNFASITIIKDSVPAGKTCTVTTFTEAGCKGKSKESSASDGCFQAALLLPTQKSAKLVCK
ncbi:MAG: hypothetical protein Q9169_008095, partial [Polycauliona sp. 2 TL-2023]